MKKEDIELIESLRNDTKYRKLDIKKLWRIYRTELNLNDRKCFCSSTERESFHKTFYEWYDENYNKL